MATIKDIRFVLAELNISKGTSRYNKAQLLEVLNDEFYNNNDLVTSCPLPSDVTTITPVHFVFDDGLCLGHSISTLFDTYVMHNNAQPMPTVQPIAAIASPTMLRITNNYQHYICLALADVYATIYTGCQVTHSLVTVIVHLLSSVVRYIIAKRLTSIISATLSSVTHNPRHVAT